MMMKNPRLGLSQYIVIKSPQEYNEWHIQQKTSYHFMIHYLKLSHDDARRANSFCVDLKQNVEIIHAYRKSLNIFDGKKRMCKYLDYLLWKKGSCNNVWGITSQCVCVSVKTTQQTETWLVTAKREQANAFIVLCLCLIAATVTPVNFFTTSPWSQCCLGRMALLVQPPFHLLSLFMHHNVTSENTVTGYGPIATA